MGAGPHGGVHGQDRFGSPQWTDNVGRMHLFIQAHPEVSITVPRQNGTKDFIAVWVEVSGDDGEGARVEVRDRSLGWLMDHVEQRFNDR